jgi:DNA-binding MarR family transcriptional regulator
MRRLLQRLEFRTWKAVRQETIAAARQMQQPNVSRALKKLISRGIVDRRRRSRDDRACAYRMLRAWKS